MRLVVVLGLGLAMLSACGPEKPKVAASHQVVAKAENRGAAWPLMLQHCLRSPNCDPTSNFGDGHGEASGGVDQANWFAQSKDVVKEGAQDYGAAAWLSLYGLRATGGKAGRPLTIDETPSTLGGANARRSTLSVEYRSPGAALEPYFLQFKSAHIAFGTSGAVSQQAATDTISASLGAMSHGPDCDGAKIEISGKAGVLLSDCSIGMPMGEASEDKYEARFEPFMFFISRNLRDEPLPKLMAAIDAGETLVLKITAASGEAMLLDAIYTGGYASALQRAGEALTDPELPRPIIERCARFENEKPEFWKIADVTAALVVCDPRSAAARQSDEAQN